MSLLSDFLEWSCSLKMNNPRKPLPSCTVVKLSLPVLHTQTYSPGFLWTSSAKGAAWQIFFTTSYGLEIIRNRSVFFMSRLHCQRPVLPFVPPNLLIICRSHSTESLCVDVTEQGNGNVCCSHCLTSSSVFFSSMVSICRCQKGTS